MRKEKLETIITVMNVKGKRDGWMLLGDTRTAGVGRSCQAEKKRKRLLSIITVIIKHIDGADIDTHLYVLGKCHTGMVMIIVW